MAQRDRVLVLFFGEADTRGGVGVEDGDGDGDADADYATRRKLSLEF